ncbi:Ionotropic receptor 690 [Blattella germanica]|nr:Ionotropic receptor 690 [Blattella germanica]
MMDLQFSILFMVIALCSTSVLLPEEETHIITCLKRISQQYFTTLNKFIILLPNVENTPAHGDRYFLNQNPTSTTTDMAQSLLKEINGMNKLVFLIQSELADLTKMKSIATWLEGPGPLYTNDVVIIFFTNTNVGTVVSKFMNSKSELIVILIFTSEYSEIEAYIVEIYLEIFAKSKFFNVLLLIPHLHTTKSKHSEVKSLSIYSWYPYDPIENCGVFHEPVLVNVWVLENEEGKFLDETVLLPKVVLNGFEGCEISVKRWFSNNNEYFGFNSFMENIGIAYLEIIASAMGMGLKVYNAHDKHSPDVEIAVLNLNSLNFFSTECPSQSYREIKLKWHVPCPQSVSRHGNFIRVFKYPTWLQLFLVAIFFGLIIHWLYKSSKNSEITPDFSGTLLRIWGILTGVSTYEGSENYKIRIFFFIWVLFCLTISTVFQAFFTRFLIEPGMYVPISNMKELNRTGITRAIPLHEYDFIVYSLVENDVFSVVNSDCSFGLCSYYYMNWDNFTFLADATLMIPMAKAAGFQSCAIEDNAIIIYNTFYIPRNSYVFNKINNLIIRITQCGLAAMMERYVLQYMETKTVSEKGFLNASDQKSSDEYFIFGMQHLKVIFYLLLTGYVMSSILFVFEKFHYYVCKH